jgi:hypothetical protein
MPPSLTGRSAPQALPQGRVGIAVKRHSVARLFGRYASRQEMTLASPWEQHSRPCAIAGREKESPVKVFPV